MARGRRIYTSIPDWSTTHGDPAVAKATFARYCVLELSSWAVVLGFAPGQEAMEFVAQEVDPTAPQEGGHGTTSSPYKYLRGETAPYLKTIEALWAAVTKTRQTIADLLIDGSLNIGPGYLLEPGVLPGDQRNRLIQVLRARTNGQKQEPGNGSAPVLRLRNGRIQQVVLGSETEAQPSPPPLSDKDWYNRYWLA